MKVEAAWRGQGRLEILVTGVSPDEGRELLDTIGASVIEDAPLPGPVGYAVGFVGGQFFAPVWHRWSGRYMSDCRRWRADNANSDFRPFLEDEHVCRECERAA